MNNLLCIPIFNNASENKLEEKKNEKCLIFIIKFVTSQIQFRI